MSESDHSPARLPAETQWVEGYLDEDLQAPDVTDGTLTPSEATLSVWGFDAEGNWRDTGADIDLTHVIDGISVEEGTYVAAAWIRSAKQWRPLVTGCGPTTVNREPEE